VLKMRDMKLRDMNMRQKTAAMENAGKLCMESHKCLVLAYGTVDNSK